MRHALRRVTCHINPCLIGETHMDGDDLFVVIYLFIFGFCLGSPLSSNMASRLPAQYYGLELMSLTITSKFRYNLQ